MLQSMTGFGKTIAILENYSIVIQITSVNSKNLDIFVRLPLFLKEKEIELRNKIAQVINRGKIDVSVNIENEKYNSKYSINQELVEFYNNEITILCNKLDLEKPTEIVQSLLKMPNVLSTTESSINTDEWEQILLHFEQALSETIRFRTEEGKIISDSIKMRIDFIKKNVSDIIEFDKLRIERKKQKLIKELESLTKIEIDNNRLEQELIYYIERLDITEEIERTVKHCDFFVDSLSSANTNGKKLTFISQEILRELNTMGVKANDAHIQKLVVEMKDEIEKVREQLSNIQ